MTHWKFLSIIITFLNQTSRNGSSFSYDLSRKITCEKINNQLAWIYTEASSRKIFIVSVSYFLQKKKTHTVKSLSKKGHWNVHIFILRFDKKQNKKTNNVLRKKSVTRFEINKAPPLIKRHTVVFLGISV